MVTWLWLAATGVSLAVAVVLIVGGAGSRVQKLQPVHAAVWVQLALAFAFAAILGGWNVISGGIAGCGAATYVIFLALLRNATTPPRHQDRR